MSDGDHCYRLFKENKNWDDAERFCQSQHGGHLAAVTNQEIHDYINNKGRDMWVGGTDKQHEGVWSWSDCSDWGFTKWRGPRRDPLTFQLPDDGDWWYRTEDCLILRHEDDDQWHDLRCGDRRQFVCSIKLCPPAGEDKLSPR